MTCQWTRQSYTWKRSLFHRKFILIFFTFFFWKIKSFLLSRLTHFLWGNDMLKTTWVRLQCGCFVTWFCYQLIAKPGNKTAAPLWPDPDSGKYKTEHHITIKVTSRSLLKWHHNHYWSDITITTEVTSRSLLKCPITGRGSCVTQLITLKWRVSKITSTRCNASTKHRFTRPEPQQLLQLQVSL